LRFDPEKKKAAESGIGVVVTAAAIILLLASCRFAAERFDQSLVGIRAAETASVRSEQEGGTPAFSPGADETLRPLSSPPPMPPDTAQPVLIPTSALGLAVRFQGMTGFDRLYLEFAVDNAGDVPLESVEVAVPQAGSGTAPPRRARDEFGPVGGEGGQGGGTLDTLSPGESGWAYSGFFGAGEGPSAGDPVEVEVRACTGDGLTGQCLTRVLTFTLP